MIAFNGPRSWHTRQRGVSLLESLVAFVVLAAGSAAVAHLQSQLRLAGDVARERSEALRLGATAIEKMRTFATLDGAPGAPSYAAIVSADATSDAASAPAAHGEYRIERRVDDAAFGAVKSARVAVRWNDRHGRAHEVVLNSVIAGVAPAYSGSLGLAAGAIISAPRGAAARSPTVPLTARNLGDGRSVWKPDEGGASALVFDNRTGAIVGRCSDLGATATRDLTAAALTHCDTGRWLLVAGTIRFTSTVPPDADDAREPPPATTVAIELRDGSYPAPAACFSEARKTVRYLVDGSLHVEDVVIDATPSAGGQASWDDTGDRFLAWHCIVAPRADGRWSGRIALVASSWTIGTGREARRVCRYRDTAADSADTAASGDEVDVAAALIGRNFLVVRGSESCPGGALATVAYQP